MIKQCENCENFKQYVNDERQGTCKLTDEEVWYKDSCGRFEEK